MKMSENMTPTDPPTKRFKTADPSIPTGNQPNSGSQTKLHFGSELAKMTIFGSTLEAGRGKVPANATTGTTENGSPKLQATKL